MVRRFYDEIGAERGSEFNWIGAWLRSAPLPGEESKPLLVQGWDDQSVMPRPTLDYYKTMQRAMGGPAPTRDFARLFMIPGMHHCAGGQGATAIEYVSVLEDWVERGRAPDLLLGVHPLPGSPLDYFGTNLSRLEPR